MRINLVFPRKSIRIDCKVSGLRTIYEEIEVPVPATEHPYTFTVGFGASDTYIRFTSKEYYGVWTAGTMTNIAAYYVKVNGVAQVLPVTIACGDDVEIRIVKTGAGTASMEITGVYDLDGTFSQSATGAELHYVDDWMLSMIESYQALHYDQLDAEMIRQLLIRLQPDYVDYTQAGDINDTGYYYSTFGPPGLNSETCNFVALLKLTPSALMNCDTDATASQMFASRVNVNHHVVTLAGANMTMKYYDGLDLYMTISTGGNVMSAFTNLRSLAVNGKIPYFSSYCYLFLATENGHIPSVDFTIRFTQYISLLYKGISRKLPLMYYSGSSPNEIRFSYNQFSELHAADTFAGLNANTRSFYLDHNNFTTAVIDDILAKINARVNQFTPAQNLVVLLNGPSNGIPTGGNNNTDRLAIIARYAAVGKTATITVRTS